MLQYYLNTEQEEFLTDGSCLRRLVDRTINAHLYLLDITQIKASNLFSCKKWSELRMNNKLLIDSLDIQINHFGSGFSLS